MPRTESPRSSKARAVLKPMKPAAPVTRMVMILPAGSRWRPIYRSRPGKAPFLAGALSRPAALHRCGRFDRLAPNPRKERTHHGRARDHHGRHHRQPADQGAESGGADFVRPSRSRARTRRSKPGASLVHIHVRDDDGKSSSEAERFGLVQEGIRKHCPGMIVQFSTGGRGRESDERGSSLALRPDMASLATGSVNFATIIYENPPALIDALARLDAAERDQTGGRDLRSRHALQRARSWSIAAC